MSPCGFFFISLFSIFSSRFWFFKPMVVDFSCNFAVPIREGELSVFYSAIFANIRNELYMSI